MSSARSSRSHSPLGRRLGSGHSSKQRGLDGNSGRWLHESLRAKDAVPDEIGLQVVVGEIQGDYIDNPNLSRMGGAQQAQGLEIVSLYDQVLMEIRNF